MQTQHDMNALLLSVALSAVESGIGGKAQPVFAFLAEHYPREAAGPVGLASIALTQGRCQDAIVLLKQALAQGLNNPEQAIKLLMMAYMLSGQVAAAGQLHNQLMPEDAHSEHHQRAAAFFN